MLNQTISNHSKMGSELVVADDFNPLRNTLRERISQIDFLLVGKHVHEGGDWGNGWRKRTLLLGLKLNDDQQKDGGDATLALHGRPFNHKWASPRGYHGFVTFSEQPQPSGRK
jgi:hypothetical protein